MFQRGLLDCFERVVYLYTACLFLSLSVKRLPEAAKTPLKCVLNCAEGAHTLSTDRTRKALTSAALSRMIINEFRILAMLYFFGRIPYRNIIL